MRKINKLGFFVGLLIFCLAPLVSFAEDSKLATRAPNNMDAGGGSTMDMMRKKRYRYRKRTHRFQIMLQGIPWYRNDDQKSNFMNLNALYGYNAGRFELGPQLRLFNPGGRDFQNLYVHLGGWLEYNFVRNTRKEKMVPALGVSTGYELEKRRRHSLALSAYFSLKYFVASRTGFAFNISYDYVSLFTSLFRNPRMGIGYSVSYVHYFN